jgi:tetratricopeptide (TPR) repeat protein
VISNWFNAREATDIGAALADQFSHNANSSRAVSPQKAAQADPLQEILNRADADVRTQRLNFYQKAKFANSFKWRLLENGIEKQIADEVTQRVLLHLSRSRANSASRHGAATTAVQIPQSNDVRYLLIQGNKCLAAGQYAEAIALYEKLLRLNPNHAEGLNNLGAAFCRKGRYDEAAECFRRATLVNPTDAAAQNNLGNLLRWKGYFQESEIWLRRAVKLNPTNADARNNLGFTLCFLGRLRDAKAHFRKALKAEPRNEQALFGLGHIAAIEGSFDEAEKYLKRSIGVNPKMPGAWAAQATLRKMTSSDVAWLNGALEIASSGTIAPLDEADLRFSIGKYYDDVNDFEKAFENYKRANVLLKALAKDYDRDARTCFVDDLVRVYTRESISNVQGGASDSKKPVFVVGMMRSGTSLAEQIIASHPAARGAGELGYWTDAADAHDGEQRQNILSLQTRTSLAQSYLKVLEVKSGDAARIIDKAPINSDHLGLIYSTFPNARIIYMRRDPIDTCLSCYFQKFSAALNFTMDLSDLAHYYREHHRLMEHWRAVLPPGSILDVPYADLVANQEEWSRKMLDFVGLEWDERCLNFHNTKREVVTASYWQVRQKMYRSSVARWRNYEKFIKPLLGLRD